MAQVDDEVPDWCPFFDPDEYEAFCAAVDGGAMSYGAEGQDLSEGTIRLATGAGYEVLPFPLDRLARVCREHPPADWEVICFTQVDDWTLNAGQRAWLESARPEDVLPRLRPWLDDGDPHAVGGQPDDPTEPYRWPLSERLYLGLLAEDVPTAHEDEPEIDTQVHNAAAWAWGRAPEELFSRAVANLRYHPPQWTEVGPVLVGRGRGAAGWVVVLPEQFPGWSAERTLVSVPAQDCLLVCHLAPGADATPAARAVADLAAAEFARGEKQINPTVYWYRRSPDGEAPDTLVPVR